MEVPGGRDIRGSHGRPDHSPASAALIPRAGGVGGAQPFYRRLPDGPEAPPGAAGAGADADSRDDSRPSDRPGPHPRRRARSAPTTEERRGGQESGRRFRSWGTPYQSKKKLTHT